MDTRSFAVAERPRDALYPSVVSSSFVVRHFGFRFTTVYTIKCCSVVFGVTLRLLVINSSSSSPVDNKRRCFTSDECHQFATVQRTCVCGGRTVDNTRRSHILVEIRDFCLLHLRSRWRTSSRNTAIRFGVEKLEWSIYPMVKMFGISLLISTEYTNVLMDRQTDGQMDRQTPHAGK